MKKTIHYRLDDGFAKGFATLEEHNRPDGKHVIVVSQSPDNDGASVTNSICTIADLLYQGAYLIDFLMEHYPKDAYRSDDYEENWSLVSFDWDVRLHRHRHPHWQHLSAEQFQMLIEDTWMPPNYSLIRSRL